MKWMRVFHIAVRIATWIIFGLLIDWLVCLANQDVLMVCDVLLAGLLLLALALGITISNSYTYDIEMADSKLLEYITRVELTCMHASECWNIVAISMVILPIYTTCTVIYLTLQASTEAEYLSRILLYSIFSLVSSLAGYIIRPQDKSTAFRNGYVELRNALYAYYAKRPPENPTTPDNASPDDLPALVEAAKKAEDFVTEYYHHIPG